MSTLTISNVRLLRPGHGIIEQPISVVDGKIASILEADSPDSARPERFDGGGRLLTPGLIDIHTHGVHTFHYEAGPDHILDCSRITPRHGTTTVLPTLVGVMGHESLAMLEALSAALGQCDGACCPGFHLEGPFLKLTGAKADTVAGDAGLLKEILAATSNKVLAMSISPDTENIIPIIEHLCENDVVPFITHTQASAEQTMAAIDAGARHATHFYDVFPIPPVTDPGVRPVGAVEAILADSRCTVDFIADGVHVHPVAIRAALAAKGWQGVILITDSNIGAGLPPGRHLTPRGYYLRTSDNDAARMDARGSPKDGSLAGSSLTMEVGISNLKQWLSIPEEQTWAMGTLNPARLLGMHNKGDLRVGADADLVLWDEDPTHGLKAHTTWVNGVCVHTRED